MCVQGHQQRGKGVLINTHTHRHSLFNKMVQDFESSLWSGSLWSCVLSWQTQSCGHLPPLSSRLLGPTTQHGDSSTGSSGWDVSAFSTSSRRKPSEAACVFYCGPVSMKTNGPAQTSLISVSWPLFTSVSHEQFSFSFTWLPFTSSHILPDPDNPLFFNSFCSQEAIQAF